MKRRLVAAVAHRRKKLLLGVEAAGPSYALSSLVAASPTGTADGSTTNAITGTYYDTNGVLMAARTITRTVRRVFISAANSTLTGDASTIATTSGTLNLTLTIKDADSTGLPGRPTAAVSWASTGTGNTFTAVSSVSDRNGVYRATFSSTVGEAKTISVTVNGQPITQTVAVTVGTPGLITPEFLAFFSNGTGTGATATTDGGAWTLRGGSGHEIVNAAAEGIPDWPTTNAYKVNANYANAGFDLLQKSSLADLAVASTRYYRWYVNMVLPDDMVGNGDHPWQDGNAIGDSCWIIGVHYSSDDSPTHDGDWQVGCSVLRDLGDGGTVDCSRGPWLTKGETYRIEVAVERLTSSTFEIDVRVYNGAGTLIAESADFPAAFGGGTLASRGPYAIKATEQADFGDYFNCGNNDFETAGNDWWNAPPYNGTFVYSYQGGFAIATDQGWIGAFGSVDGE